MITKIFRFVPFRLCRRLVKQKHTKEKVIYLTFDDGPEPGITEFILDVLKRYNAKATFFCIGENFEKYPDIVEEIKKQGHTFGNHTYSHPNVFQKSKLYLADLNKCKEIIKTNLFRPPYGMIPIALFKKIRSENQIILWDINSKDYIVNHCCPLKVEFEIFILLIGLFRHVFRTFSKVSPLSRKKHYLRVIQS